VYPKLGLSWKDFKFAIIITAPAVILHELAHKFVAMAMGLTATFHAWYTGLGIGVFYEEVSDLLKSILFTGTRIIQVIQEMLRKGKAVRIRLFLL